MKNRIEMARLALVLVVVAGVGLLFAGVACQRAPGGDGEEPVDPCADVDCPEGQVCQDGQCVPTGGVENPFEAALANFENNGSLHNMDAGGHVEGFPGSCTSCHHAEPNAAGKACDDCHSREEGRYDADLDTFVPKLKEAMHAPAGTESGNGGCRACHNGTTEDGSWDCSKCHAAFGEL